MISRKVLSNTLKILSMDIVENSNSGHPGSSMGMSDISEVLWRKFMNFNPKNSQWINRDRFVLSNGHCSPLLYSLLHLTGYNVSISDLKNFRKLNSNTPGHPEYSITDGVEVTTGPLGQGLANAIGFAISEKILSKQFNKENINIIDHNTYVFVGDGCLMEGISHEVCSLAGKLNLNKLIVIYDKNNVSIDGYTDNWFIDDTEKRFLSYKWNVINNIDGHNIDSIENAINKSIISDKPSLLIFNTKIAFGSPNKCGDYKTHGLPLGKEESYNTRKNLNWHYDPFFIPKEIYKEWNYTNIGIKKENKWNKLFLKYKLKFPKLFEELNRRINKQYPIDWDIYLKKIFNDIKDIKNISTRKASQNIIEYFVNKLPELIGGSSDLTSSVLTNCSKSISINNNFYGNYINYGVREFGMTSISNGISIYNGFIPYSGTFLSFMDYAKSAVRLASLMKIRNIFIYTHDSIGIGEDGPTHQPIEQINNLRIIPNLDVWRPFNQIETFISWKFAIEKTNGPTSLILSRQNILCNINTKIDINNIYKGAYILEENINNNSNNIDLIIISTGSEIELSYKIYNFLLLNKYSIRLVSIPSTTVFDKQDKLYYDYILPKKSKKIVIEASHPDFWYKYIGNNGKIIGIKSFGKSGSKDDLYNYFGFNFDNIKNIILNYI